MQKTERDFHSLQRIVVRLKETFLNANMSFSGMNV